MRSRLFFFFVAVLALAAGPACGGSITDLTFTVNNINDTGYGAPTNLTPDGDPPCLPPNCVLFNGTLTDTDDDASAPVMVFPLISVAFSTNPASGMLTLDNTFYDSVDYFPGTLSGDPNYATDGSPPTTYAGSLFGIDIAPGTSVGVYTGTITIDVAGGLNDPLYGGFIVTAPITVVVTPEPAAGSLSLVGLAALVVWCGVKRKWRPSEASLR
jgi:hypothetical protein